VSAANLRRTATARASDRSQKRVHFSDFLGVLLGQIARLARVGGQIVQVRHRAVPQLDVGVRVHWRPFAGLHVFPCADAKRVSCRLQDQLLSPHLRCAEKRRDRIQAVRSIAGSERLARKGGE
jgi:hypothetical protein